MRTINNVVKEEFNLGIVRYQESFEQYFQNQFREKKLICETVAEFSYFLLMNREHPFADREDIRPEELSPYFEICHADPYVPSLPLIDVKKAELSEYVDKRIYVYERASQFMLLRRMPNAFMWVSSVSDAALKEYNLVQKHCSANQRKYKDVLIYRSDYKLSPLDHEFIRELNRSKEVLYR